MPKLGIQHKIGLIEKIGEPVKSDIDHVQKFLTLTPDWADDSIKPILATEGWMSKGGVDRVGDIVEPDGWDISDFLNFPAFMMHHDWRQMLLGIWTNVDIRQEGLYGRNVIYGTAIGQDMSLLIRAGVYRSFSVGFDPTEFTFMDDNGIRFVQQSLIETSVVPSPAHVGATIETVDNLSTADIVREAKEHNLTLKYFTAPRKSFRKDTTMTSEEKAALAADTDAKIAAAVKAQSEVTAAALGDKFKAVASIQKTIEDLGKEKHLSEAEVKQLVENVTADYTKTFNDMQAEIKTLKAKKNVSLLPKLMPGTLKGMMKMTPAVLRGSLPTVQAEQVQILQKMNDDLLLVDAALATSSEMHGGLKELGNYHKMPKAERIQKLKGFRAVSDFAKAMDSETATEGAEWVHVAVSGSLIEDIRLAQVIAPNFTEIRLTGPTMEIDTDDGDTLAKLIGEKKTAVSGFDTNQEDYPSGKMAFAVKKARGFYQISTELTEDAAFAVLPLYRAGIVRSIARSEDNAIMNGNDSGTDANLDSGITLASTDFRKAFKGLRYYQFQTINSGTQGDVIGIDGSTHNAVKHGKVRGQMGKYGSASEDLRIFSSVTGYLLRLLNADEMPQFHTLEKYGSQAVVLTGEAGRIYNVRTMQTDFMADDQNAVGVHDGITEDRTSMIYVNTQMFLRGLWRDVEVTTFKDVINDVWYMLAFKRMDFKPTFIPSSTVKSVNMLYNLATN